MNKKFLSPKLACAAAILLAVSCKKSFNDQDKDLQADLSARTANTEAVVLQNHSVTPALIKALPGFENLEIYSLISSDDTLKQSPGYVFGGSADGSGLLRGTFANGRKNFIYIVNHEDNYAVSRVIFDASFKPIKGEYILNSNGGLWRLCSATMATPGEQGFGPTYFTSGESGEESRTHALNPLEKSFSPTLSKELPALGRWSAENAVPLHKNAFAGKTIIMLGDDDSGVEGGQLAMYMSDAVGDLTNGSVYVLRRKDINIRERDMTTGNQYDVEFVKIDNIGTLTGRQVNTATAALSAIRFGRVEDIDYRKGNGAAAREVYFNVTGQSISGTNADFSRTKYGRTYKLVMDKNNPLSGKLEVILDGDDDNGPANAFQNVDNICVTANYAYIQEDANGYGDETHDAYIYQYNLNTKEFKKVTELDHRRTEADALIYNPTGASPKGSWEYGAMIDISDMVGVPDVFMVCIQPHTWRNAKYAGVDGGTLRPTENQASEVVVIKGLPR